MNEFGAGDIDILVSTTVVEVGINVPEATLIVIENAERFGLAQLHQLRGRVGRSERESWCLLRSDAREETPAYDRLKVLTESNDGFRIAQADLEYRGAGDFIGTMQSGENKYVGLMLGWPKKNTFVKELVKKCYNDKVLSVYFKNYFQVASE